MQIRAIVFVGLMACGGGNGGGLTSDPVTADQAEPLCRQDCQHDADCGDGTDVDACTQSCVDDSIGWARGDAIEAIIECTTALACDANDVACVLHFEPLAIHDEWETACRAQFASCLGDAGAVESVCEV